MKAALDERWSYRRANGADFDAAIGALRKRVEAGIGGDELGLELQKVIALGIDGHAAVTGYSFPPGGRLPFLVESAAGGLVAVTPDRKAFLADGFPFLVAIDGRPIAEWRAAAGALVPKGSAQYVLHGSLRRLRRAGLLADDDGPAEEGHRRGRTGRSGRERGRP